MLPQYRKQDTLQTIGQDLGFQSTKHEPRNTRFGEDVTDHLDVRQLIRMRLLVHFDDANRVGAGVRDGRRTEAQQRPTSQFRQLRVLLGDLFRQEVVRKEPTVELNMRVLKSQTNKRE